MPIYTYRCENCGVQFDQKQKFTDSPLVTCPECGKKALRKVYQPVGIVFKGSGFYATDHRSPSGGYPSASKEEKPPSTEKPAVPAESTPSSAESSHKENTKEATTSTTPAAK
jgi:putative FmdB family regulatory protein